jgi:Flp pilus assembly protein TadG
LRCTLPSEGAALDDRGAPDRQGRGRSRPAAPAWLRAAGRRAIAFARNESGAVSVEAVLWLPFFFGFLMLVTDVSMAFYGKAQTYRIVQDVNRALSVGRITTPTQAKTVLINSMNSLFPNGDPYPANSQLVSVCLSSGNSVVSTTVQIPIQGLVVFTSLGGLMRGNVVVSSASLLEKIPQSNTPCA